MTWTNPSPRSTRIARPGRTGPRILVWGAAAAVVLVAAAMLIALLVDEPDPTRLVGEPAPEFSLPDLVAGADDAGLAAAARSVGSGRNVAPSDPVSVRGHLGQAWVLHTFGTWCRPCNEEHPALVKYASTHRLTIVGVDQGDERPDVLAWLAKHGNPYSAVVADETGEFVQAYDVKGVPQYFVIDASGVIRARFYGPLDEDELEKRLGPWVAAAH